MPKTCGLYKMGCYPFVMQVSLYILPMRKLSFFLYGEIVEIPCF
ncbi:hypothetical protein SAMN05660226_01044 [Parapedobacter luteus]|uniref:Uncharacterized protein n=1 Tax=Parapedobacter luteus TaxID=623280 RepID=A0A1T5AUB5_9SPHI|nr:hypothetical protein SAMN05660226_01044 [Parapedobacter luteus]